MPVTYIYFDQTDMEKLNSGEKIEIQVNNRIRESDKFIMIADQTFKNLKRYKINYGFGIAYLDTPYDPVDRFYKLANTCFGIRKSIMRCSVVDVEDLMDRGYERLSFDGDSYIWRTDGARKMVTPWPDDDWYTDYCEECKHIKG